jgi:hypothetical protein
LFCPFFVKLFQDKTVSPQPARDYIKIDLPETAVITRYKIYDMLGSIMQSGEGAWSGQMRLDIGGLAPGVYALVINDKSYRFMKFNKE